ncbi:unnamed protein product, partial [Coregonus sp. 'balchen']
SSTETLKLFVLKGQNVRLDVQGYAKLKDIDDLKWTFNKSHNLVKYFNESSKLKAFPKYQGRVEFSEGKFSVLLKNLQEGDSGLYHAVVSGEENKDVAKYQISVHDNSQAGGEEQVSPGPGPASPSIYSMVGHSNPQPLNHPTMVRDQPPTVDLPMSPMPPMPESLYAVIPDNCQAGGEEQVSPGPGPALPTIYSLVGHQHPQPVNHQPPPVDLPMSTMSTMPLIPESLYAVIPDNSQAGGEEQVSPGPGPALPTIYSLVGHQHPQPVNHQPPPVDLPMSTMSTMPPMPESLYAVVGKKTSKQ